MALQAATSPVLAIIFRFSLALRSEIKTEGFASPLDKPFPSKNIVSLNFWFKVYSLGTSLCSTNFHLQNSIPAGPTQPSNQNEFLKLVSKTNPSISMLFEY